MLDHSISLLSRWLWVLAFVATMACAVPDKDLRLETVQFKPPIKYRIIQAKIHSWQTVDYVLQGQPGQVLSVKLESNNRFNFFNVLAPNSETAIFVGMGELEPDHFSTQLNAQGQYRIRVFLNRNAARRKESARYRLEIGLLPSPMWLEPALVGHPTRLDLIGKPFAQQLRLMGVQFDVACSNSGNSNTLSIKPTGLTIDNTPITRPIEGHCTGAEVGDLNVDGAPELYVYLHTSGPQQLGSLVAYSTNHGKSLSEISLPALRDHPAASVDYQGRDDFALVENNLVRRFPIPAKTNPRTHYTVHNRQLQYKLKAGEATMQLYVDRMVEF